MKRFFHGWQRKFGVASLVLALLLLTGWVRSRVGNEALLIQLNGSRLELRSEKGAFHWVHRAGNSETAIRSWIGRIWLVCGGMTSDSTIAWSSWPRHIRPAGPYEFWNRMEWQKKLLGLEVSHGPSRSPFVVTIPYLPMIIILTIISAALVTFGGSKVKQTFLPSLNRGLTDT